MRSRWRSRIAVISLLCSSGVASAAGTGTAFQVSDNLVLSGAQEYLIWQRVAKPTAAKASASTAAAFEPSMYGVVPSSIALRALPADVTRQVPMVSPYRYTTLGKLLLLVNPTDRTIVDIIRP